MPKLSDLAEINPKRQLPSDVSLNDEVSFIPMGDVSESGEWERHRTRPVSGVLLGFTPFLEEDVLFAKITPCMENGKGAHAVELRHGVGFGSTEFHVLRARANVSSRFLFHLCQSKRLRLAAEAHMIGSAGQQRVQKEFFGQYDVIDLPFVEQQKIAQILDTLDTQIRQTEALIAKLERIKQGLLTDLLTRGIDENGQLRPPPEEAPHLYKDSPLGWIPRGWNIKPLADLAEVNRGKFTHRPRNDPAYYGGDFPFIQTGDVAAAKGGLICTYSQTLSELGTTASTLFPKGTIAITIAANIADTAILGIPMYFPDSVVGAIVHDDVDTRYVELCIRDAKRGLDAKAPQSAQKNINLQDLRPLPIPTPSLREQQAIAKRYETLIERIDSEGKSLTKLLSHKAGLMDDLLTGRVRVTPLLDTAKQAYG